MEKKLNEIDIIESFEIKKYIQKKLKLRYMKKTYSYFNIQKKQKLFYKKGDLINFLRQKSMRTYQ